MENESGQTLPQEQATAQEGTAPQMSSAPKPKMNKKLLVGLGVLIVIVLAITAVFAGSGNSKAQELLRQAIGNQNDLNSVTYIGDISIQMLKDGEDLGSADIVLRGDATNLQNPENLQMQFSVNVTDSGTLTGGEESVIKTSIILDGSTLYFRLDNFDSAGFPFDLSTLTKQWIRIDDIESQAENFGSASALGISPASSELSEEQLEEVSRIAQNADVLVVTKDLGTDEGQHHFAYRIDFGNLLALMIELGEFLDEEISDEEISEMEEALSELGKDLSATGEIWIDEDSTQLTRIVLDMELNETEDSPAMRVNMDMEIRNFNEAVEINVPITSITFEEAFGLVMASIFDFSAVPTE